MLDGYVEVDDYDHWVALNEIAARLHRAREPFPEALADWAAEVHEEKRRPPAKERGHRGEPPYAREDRNGVFFMADDWLKHFGLESPDDRVNVISRYIGDDETVVRKGLTRWRNKKWRRAPWP